MASDRPNEGVPRLVGRRVFIGIVDPWDFATENGPSRTGTIDAAASNRLAIRLVDPLVDPSGPVTAIVGSLRHGGTALIDLLNRRSPTFESWTHEDPNFNFWAAEDLEAPVTSRGRFIGPIRLLP